MGRWYYKRAEKILWDRWNLGWRKSAFSGWVEVKMGLEPEELSNSKCLSLYQRDTKPLGGGRHHSVQRTLNNQDQGEKLFFQRK